MTEIPETQRNEINNTSKFSLLMADLAIAEEMLHYFQQEELKYKSNPNCDRYANAVNWIVYYLGEIKKLSAEIDHLQIELFGEENPMQTHADTVGTQGLQIPHHDIDAILDGIAPHD